MMYQSCPLESSRLQPAQRSASAVPKNLTADLHDIFLGLMVGPPGLAQPFSLSKPVLVSPAGLPCGHSVRLYVSTGPSKPAIQGQIRVSIWVRGASVSLLFKRSAVRFTLTRTPRISEMQHYARRGPRCQRPKSHRIGAAKRKNATEHLLCCDGVGLSDAVNQSDPTETLGTQQSGY